MKKQLLTLALLGASICIANAQSSLPNGGMEEWVTISSTIGLERPALWWGSDQVMNNISTALTMSGYTIVPKKQITKSNDRYEGSYAARIMTRNFEGGVGLLPGVMANGEIAIDPGALLSIIASGAPITDISSFMIIRGGTNIMGNQVDSVSAYILAPAANDDVSAMMIMAMQYTNIGGVDTLVQIGSGMQLINPMAGFQRIVTPMIYTDPSNTQTDTLRIVFMSSYIADAETLITEENRIFVDKVEKYISEPSSIKNGTMNLGFEIYPNPSNGYLYINNPKQVSNCHIDIVEMLGKVVYEQKLQKENTEISLKELNAGMYFYKISNENNQNQQTGKIIVK